MDRFLRLALLVVLWFSPGLLTGCASQGTAVIRTSPTSAIFTREAVAADHPVASEAGAEILRAGGNAVDAAVATSFTLSVVRPESCGIGGGGFMIIVEPPSGGRNGEAAALNYRETAPAAVTRDWYINLDDARASRWTTHAAGVPGTVAGLLYAHQTRGVLDRAAVLAPAIAAAERGFVADATFVASVEELGRHRAEHPDLAWLSDEFWRDVCRGGDVRIGDLITNPKQGAVLRRIAEEGARGFYDGPVAAAIAGRMRETGGPMTAADLRQYTVRESVPLETRFQGRRVLTMPPPSSGGIALLQVLGLLERVLPDDLEGAEDTSYMHLLAESMKHAFADRATWLADDAYVDVPTAHLTSSGYLDDRAAMIGTRTLSRFEYGSTTPAPDDGGTSHFCVIDANGMAVSCTETINLRFGSRVEVPGCGFMLNNEMDDFTTIPGQPNAFGLQQSDRNLPEPGKRPLSSMTPTIVMRNGAVEMIAGGSGGPRIINGTLQCLLNAMVFDHDARESVDRPRFHHQWVPEILYFEDGWTNAAAMRAMESRGHEVGRRSDVGNIQMIRVEGDQIHAASDPRKGGVPAGQ